jgi:hypothetical protein
VALHGSGNNVSIPELIDPSTVLIEGWIKPVRIRLLHFDDAELRGLKCALLGRPGDPVLLADFRLKQLLLAYDYSPYSGESVIAVLRLEATGFDRSPDEIERFAGYTTFRVVD